MTGLHAIASWRAPHEPAHQSVSFDRHVSVSAVPAEQDIEVPPILGDPEARPEFHAHSRADIMSVGACWIGEGVPVPPQSEWIPAVKGSSCHWTGLNSLSALEDFCPLQRAEMLDARCNAMGFRV